MNDNLKTGPILKLSFTINDNLPPEVIVKNVNQNREGFTIN